MCVAVSGGRKLLWDDVRHDDHGNHDDGAHAI